MSLLSRINSGLMMNFTAIAGIAAALLMFGSVIHVNAADSYPIRPIRMVIPFPPGGSNDVIGRIVAQKLTSRLNMQVIVDNRGGAAGAIAIDIVKRATPDGYTMLLNSSGIVLTPALSTKVDYDLLNDFSPVILISSVPMVLLVHPSVPANTIQEFIAYAKANPGKLTYGSAGTGNITHLGVLLLQQAAGIDVIHVPYKGAGPALVDAISGNTNFVMSTLATAAGVLKDKRMKPLAVTGLTRSPVIKDVPTLSESVMPNLEATTWQGILLPARASRTLIGKLNFEVNALLKEKDVVDRFAVLGASALGSSADEYRAYLSAELQRWQKIIKNAGVRLD